MKRNQYFLGILGIFFIGMLGHGQYAEEEWEERDTWMDVSKIFEMADIEAGSKVADIGCHEGYLAVRLSKRVGEEGLVYAVDVRDDRLDVLKENIKERDLKNIKPILGDYDDPKLPVGILDVVFVMDTYHEIDDYIAVLSHINKALKPGGRILILEKLKEHSKNKTRDDQMDSHTLSSNYVKKDLEAIGMKITKQISDFGQWENDKDKTMWVLVAIKEGD